MERRHIALVLSVAAAVACKTTPESASEKPPESSLAEGGVPHPRGHVELMEAPFVGDVAPMVHDAAAAASGRHRRLLVYAGAVWCEPCRRFHAAAASGELDDAFPDLTLIEFDLDRDRDRLKAAGYTPQYIPLFALPSTDGTWSGKSVEGAIKGDGAVGFLVPKIHALLAQ